MNRNKIVDDYLKKKNHLLTQEIQRVREIILSTHKDIEETIKWSSPTFIYKGNMASYFMNAKKHVSLMFHYGASLPNKDKLLEGDGKVGKAVKFMNMKDIETKKKALQNLVKEWIKMQDGE
jgi:hypothetical protein